MVNKTPTPDTLHSTPSRKGFTLLEALVAMVMLTVIMYAVTMALSVSLRAQTTSSQRQEESGTVRAIFGILGRDLQAACGSLNSPASVFMAGGSGGKSATESLLTFTSLSGRIQAEGLDQPDAKSSDPSQPSAPQSDMALIHYEFDSLTGTLRRTVSQVPNLQAMMQPTTTESEGVLAREVQSIRLRFWDAENKNWREDWDFVQQKQAQSQNTSNGQSSQNGQNGQGNQSGQNGQNNGGSSGDDSSNGNGADGDKKLPGAVEITLTLKKKTGASITYTTMLPIVAPELQKKIDTPSSQSNTNQNGNSNQPNQQGQQPNQPNQPNQPTSPNGNGGGRP